MRAATGKFEFISFHRDFHGKTMGAVGLAPLDSARDCAPRASSWCPAATATAAPSQNATPSATCVRGLHPHRAQGGDRRAAWRASCSSRSRAGPAAWCRRTAGSRRSAPCATSCGILLMADEVLTCMGRTGKMFAMEHWDTVPDVMTLGKGFGNGFPVTAMLVSEKYKEAIEKISASTSYGGNPMACAAALASIEVIEEEDLCERRHTWARSCSSAMKAMQAAPPHHRRGTRAGLPAGHRAGQGQGHAGSPSRRPASWSTRRPSARDWPGSRPGTSCACPRR